MSSTKYYLASSSIHWCRLEYSYAPMFHFTCFWVALLGYSEYSQIIKSSPFKQALSQCYPYLVILAPSNLIIRLRQAALVFEFRKKYLGCVLDQNEECPKLLSSLKLCYAEQALCHKQTMKHTDVCPMTRGIDPVSYDCMRFKDSFKGL